jgi:hypothetical protein
MMTEEEIKIEKIREIRKRIAGLSYLKYVRDNPNASSLRYENENAIPKDMQLRKRR